MRRIASFLLLSALLVAGCSGHDSTSPGLAGHRPLAAPTVPAQHRPPVPDPVTSDTVLPTVSGKFGQKALIRVPRAKPSGTFVVRPTYEGKGRKAKKNDVVIVNYTAKSWRDGSPIPGTYKKGAAPRIFSVGHGAVIPALDKAVPGQREGSRVLVVAPPAAAYGSTGNARLGVSGTDTVIFVVDIMKVVAADAIADGQQKAVTNDLLQVEPGPGPSAIGVPDAAAPGHLVARTLVEGFGPAAKAGQSIVIQYSTAVWAENRGQDRARLLDSSWRAHSPTTVVIGRGNVIKGWDTVLVGTRVGSRLTLIVPPALGYGTQAHKGVPANSTLICVIDVLAAV